MMKKYAKAIIIAVLIALQVVSLARIGDLQKELIDTKHQLANLASEQSRSINNIYTNIDSMLKRQSSIIDSFDYLLGELDADKLTIPVTFTVTPKEIKEDTIAKIYVSGENAVMSRNGTSFTATIPVDIFSTFEAKVILSDSEIERTEGLEVYQDLRESVLPTIYAQFEGHSGSSYRKKPSELSGEYYRKGNLYVEAKSAAKNTIKEASLVIDIDGDVISEKPIENRDEHTNGFFADIEERFTLSAGQTLTMSVVAKDSFGLIHKTIIELYSLDENADPMHGDEWTWMGHVTIMDKDGNILYEPRIIE